MKEKRPLTTHWHKARGLERRWERRGVGKQALEKKIFPYTWLRDLKLHL
jgi:hypothetical protein